MDIKIYDIVFDNENPDDLFLCNSLVDLPAVEVDFLAFKQQSIEDKEKLFTFEKDTTEHKIFGVAIRCDFPIYRIDNFGREYFVRFSKETIEQLVLKYSKENNFNLVSLQHDGNLVEGVNLVELFIKDTEKGINPKGFEHIEEGSLFCTYKVENPEVWEKIQNGEIKGFSVEICCDIQPTNETIELSKQQPEETDINSFIDDLYKYLVGEGIDSNEIEILFADSKKKLNELIEEAIENDTKVNVKLDGKSKSIQGFIYSSNDNIITLYDNNKDDWHIVQKNTIITVNIINTNISVNWDKAFANPDFQNILNIIRETPDTQPKATVGNDIIEDAIINKKVVMVKYDDETEFNCKTFRQGYILTKIINRKGNLCLRFFENSGATHSNEENPLPSWRCLRVDRLVDIKFAPEIFKPLEIPPKGWNPTMSVERDGAVVLLKSQF